MRVIAMSLQCRVGRWGVSNKHPNFCNRLWGSWLWFGDITVRSELNNLFLHILVLPIGKTPWGIKLYAIRTSVTFVIQERSAHTRTWNLKAALGPKPHHTNVNQINMCSPKRFLLYNTKKNQISSLRNQVSNHVQFVASPQCKNQWKCAWWRSSLISAFFF